MSILSEWIIWAVLTLVWNAANSANSRAKNSASLSYNLWTTAFSAALYMTALLWIGNLLLKAHGPEQIALAIFIYGVNSSLGSVAGQQIALWLERRHGMRTS